jgi:hypothetical protein
MRKPIAALVMVALSVLGTGTAVASGGTHGSARHGVARHTRHVESVASGSGLITIDGGVITFTAEGRIQFKHLGRFTYHLEGICPSVRPDCSAPEVTTVYEKANGDTFTTVAPVGPIGAGLDYIEGVVGGTGRFAGASGTLTEISSTSVFDPSNPLAFTQTFVSRGTIRY